MPVTCFQKASFACLVTSSVSAGLVVSALGIVIGHTEGSLGEAAVLPELSLLSMMSLRFDRFIPFVFRHKAKENDW